MLGACVYPPSPIDELPNPVCPRFDGAELRGASFAGGRIDGATFEGADLREVDFSAVLSTCQDFAIDPALNDGLTTQTLCSRFRGADLRGSVFASAVFDGADFRAVDGEIAGGAAAADFTSFGSGCFSGFEVDEDGDIVAVDYCPRFEGAVLPRAVFDDATMSEARFGCLEAEAGATVAPPCTDLEGASFDRLLSSGSRWVAVDLSPESGQAVTFAAASVDGATFTCRGFHYEVFDMEDPPQVIDVVASVDCIDFTGTELTPDFVGTNALYEGVDWSTADLTGADLSGSTIQCFTYTYTDENGDDQTIERCPDLGGAEMDEIDLTDGTVEDVDFTGASLGDATLVGVSFLGNTRMNAAYDPVGETDDERKDNCTSATPVDLEGADLSGADLRDVVDFGGTCIKVNPSTFYTSETLGLTDAVKAQMTDVPEPGPLASAVSGLAGLAALARRRAARQRRRAGD